MYISLYVVVNTFIGGRQPQNKLMRLRTFKNIPSGPMPWVMACCHTGCLLFTEGMKTRIGQKAACGAKGGIMDSTKS